MTDHDFPSMIYAVSKICEFMNWDIDIVESLGNFGIDVGNILKKVDDKTLFVATSHVYFKSAYVQDIAQIVAHARRAGALTLIDGYHAPGTLPVDVKALGVDFYVGGCLKWLCGGPGNAFLYVRPELRESLQPRLTGWFAHKVPFMFSSSMVYADDSYKFMSGTPPISSLYTALAGLDIIENITVPQIRTKSLSQTKKIMQMAKERDYRIYTPFNDHLRGGAVSVGVPHAYQMKQALEQRGVKVDFRKGKSKEADVIRVGPHFYTKDEEIHLLFDHMDSILSSGDFEGFPESSETVT
jgi:kynureninase